MNPLATAINSLSRYTEKLGVCGNTGLIVGSIAGTILTFLNLVNPISRLNTADTTKIALILTFFCWFIILFIFKAFVRYRIRTIWLPSLINVALVCFATTFITNSLGLFTYAWFIGISVGMLIGYFLCKLSNNIK